MINPCLVCGACCAFFRASFYWGESDITKPDGVPAELTEKLNDFRMVMKGSNDVSPRCVVLMGIIGKKVHCGIYEKRASVCRDFQPSWLDGVYNARCDRARAHWGLAPLTPEIWTTPSDNFPRKAA
ncbi:MAG: YkgJ family cysteine cluster protein [Pseudomonadota bacterium]